MYKLANENANLNATYETDSKSISKMRMKSTGFKNYSNVVAIDQTVKLAEIDEALRSEVEPIHPMHFPATLNQNCLTQGSTIKPQIDWIEFEYAMKAKGIKITYA
jgi:hypothetical protein